MIISKSHCGEPIHENRLIRNRVVCDVLSRVAFLNPMLFQHFDVIYAFYYTWVTILNYPILVKQHECIYIKHRSLMITGTHCVRKGENIRDADVASDLPRVTLYSPDRPKMNDILVFENLKTDRLMSLVRRLVI